ncbi:transcription regulator [Rhodotorula toruloides]|uniref:Transcription regulator n=1 Tax=Rhodotorula toruloides TaxID=5286 RepID=A0A511KFG7_RHOTO|nr:transcription regulator [Rhodotorula toruloides]
MFAGNGGAQIQGAADAGPLHEQMRASYAAPVAQAHYERPAYAEHAGFTQSIRPGSRPTGEGGVGQTGSGSSTMQDGAMQGGYGGTQQAQMHNPGHPQRPPSVVVSANPYGSTSSPHMASRRQNVASSPHMQHQQHQQQLQPRQQQFQPGPSPVPPHTPYANPAPTPYSNSPATYPQLGPSPYQQHQQPHVLPPQRHQQSSGPFPSHPPDSQGNYAPSQPYPSPSRPHYLSPHAPHPAHDIPPNTHSRQLSYPQPPAQHPPHVQPQQPSQQQRDLYGEAEKEELQQRRAQAHADAMCARLTRQPERERRFAGIREDEEVVPVSAPLQVIDNGYTAAPLLQQQQHQGQVHNAPRVVPEVAEPFDLLEDEDQRLRFHAYLLDYLQKAGFLSTAAALLSDSPSIPTHSPTSGRSYVLPRPRFRRGISGNSSLFSTSPSALSPLPLGPPPSQPISPRKDAFGVDTGPTNADTVGSTASTASTATHFGFEGSGRGATDDEDGALSPAKDGGGTGSPLKRTSQANSRNISGSSTSGEPSTLRIPAAKVQIETDQGFLYEWWSVFWDVFRAKATGAARNANPAAARSFVQASSAAVDVAMQRQANAHAQARAQAEANQQAQAQGRRPAVHARGPAPPLPQRRPSFVVQPSFAPELQQQPPPQPNAPRAPIPLRQPDNPNLPAQPEPASHSAREPSAPTDEATPAPGGTRRSSSHKSAILHGQALQRQQEQQAEINARMAQARVHAQQIHSRHVLPHSPSVGTPGTPASSGHAASPVQPFSSNALNYNPDRLQQTTEAYNRYRASLVASQQTQLELARRQLSKDKGRRASSTAAEGSMPPPPTTQRTSTSLDNTPRNNELPLPPTPSASGASVEAPAANKAAETAAYPAGTELASAAMSKRRRSSMANSISETRESKKRVTQQHSSAASADQPAASPAVIAVLPLEISTQLAKESRQPGGIGVLQDDAADAIRDYLATDPPTSSDGLTGLDSTSLDMDMPVDANGQLSLEQLDRLLSSTVDAASAPYSSSDVQLGDSATFDYNEFLTAFGSEGPASYDPTVQTFDLAV